MITIMFTAIMIICGLLVTIGLILGLLVFIRRNTEIPYTPKEDEEQMKYLEEYFSKKK
jgi:hypothetical protein